MSQIDENSADSRKYPRLSVAPMYTHIRAKRRGSSGPHNWIGHIYDISLTGMRFELDSPIDPGTVIDIRAMLPGANHTTFNASGVVIRFHDDENLGPCRMGLMFDEFDSEEDHENLINYINRTSERLAA